MASLKEQFQIKTVAAFQAADGTRFHDLPAAQAFTRNKMLESAIDLAVKQNAQFTRLDRKLLLEFLLLSGEVVGKIMAEPLAPTEPARPVTVTNTVSTGEDPAVLARLRAAVSETNGNPMPRAVNPDIFGNKTIAAARAVDEQELEAGIEASLKQAVM